MRWDEGFAAFIAFTANRLHTRFPQRCSYSVFHKLTSLLDHVDLAQTRTKIGDRSGI